ncbi:MAG: NifB/NifX family molybdenum-iron cluster-binding protein [Spirochaetota bacterium]|nr:NifB/NifX family molybdenum-iron cluster-binding protein [Spirochaetota bacterium]
MRTEIIAFPVYMKRISPLFDVAGRFIIFVISNNEISQEHILDSSYDSGIKKIETLKHQKVNTIICSAISRIFANLIISNGMNLIPGVVGSVDEVIEDYINNNLRIDKYAMPGCRWRRKFRGGLCPYYNEIFFDNGIKRR